MRVTHWNQGRTFKRMEETLALKEAALHVALDNMPGALVYTDTNLDIVISRRTATTARATSDDVATEETGTITVKGFAKPVRTHRVVGILDASEGRVMRKEQDGLLLILDQRKLTGESREEARRMLIEAAERLK